MESCIRQWYFTPNLKLACFVSYLKIINTSFSKIMHASYSKLSEELKNGNEILARQAVLDRNIILTVLIHNFKNFNAILSSLDYLLQDACIIFRKSVDNFEIAHKTCLF